MSLNLERDVLCVIPARLGSKGIPRKNLCKVGGIPLLQRAIEYALDLTSNVVVTTEAAEVAALAGLWGARLIIAAYPPKYHGDDSRAADVWKHAWISAEQMLGRRYEASMYLEPTSPCRERWMACEAFATLVSNADTVDEVWTMEAVPEKFRAARQYEVLDGVLYPSQMAFEGQPRQRMPTTWVKNGAVYCARRDSILLQTGKSQVVPLVTKHLVNIDTLDDLAEAEAMLTERDAFE